MKITEAGPLGSRGSVPHQGGEKQPVSVVDRRRVGKSGKAAAVEPNLKPSYVQELEERVDRAEAALRRRIEELDEESRRSRERIRADLELRFAQRERDLLLEVLPMLDDLDRAAALASESPAIAEGLALVSARTNAFLKKHGCEQFVPEGEPFDPNSMDAVAVLEGPANQVVKVFQCGYVRGGELLRPARVAVGRP